MAADDRIRAKYPPMGLDGSPCAECGVINRMAYALAEISRMPCITALLGDDLGHDCGCASCLATRTLEAEA